MELFFVFGSRGNTISLGGIVLGQLDLLLPLEALLLPVVLVAVGVVVGVVRRQGRSADRVLHHPAAAAAADALSVGGVCVCVGVCGG